MNMNTWITWYTITRCDDMFHLYVPGWYIQFLETKKSGIRFLIRLNYSEHCTLATLVLADTYFSLWWAFISTFSFFFYFDNNYLHFIFAEEIVFSNLICDAIESHANKHPVQSSLCSWIIIISSLRSGLNRYSTITFPWKIHNSISCLRHLNWGNQGQTESITGFCISFENVICR